ncbi:MAG: hypothetical protein IIY27_00725 [Aeriscardovia sp.]|nr:hypothetical protein [Aeriscardovia sp.]
MRYIKYLSALLLGPLLILPFLAGCGNTPSQESASQAFSSPSVWFVSNYPAGSKVQISQILYFSSGNVTAYNATPGFTYAQIFGKSSQAILQDALSMDKAQFEKSVESDVASLNQIISTQKAIETGAQTAMASSSAQGNAAARQSQIRNAQSAIEAAQKSIENVQNAAFEAPSPVPYTLSGSTLSFSAPEASGGETAACSQQQLSCSAVLSSPYKTEDFSFDLTPSFVVRAGNKPFSGFRVGTGSSATYLQTQSNNRFTF